MIIVDPANPAIKFSTLNKGLVGHWRLDEESFNPATKRFTDKSAYSNHGTGNGTQLGSATPGFQADHVGQLVRAAPFNGSNDYINCGNNSELIFGTGNFSISVWIYPTSFIVNIYPAICAMGSIGNNEWMLRLATSTSIEVYGGQINIATVAGFTFVDRWTHVVFIRESDNAYMYLDDVYLGLETGIAAVDFSTAEDLRIGNAEAAAQRYLTGNLADLRIYNRALSQQEITLLYESYRPAWKLGT